MSATLNSKQQFAHWTGAIATQHGSVLSEYAGRFRTVP